MNHAATFGGAMHKVILTFLTALLLTSFSSVYANECIAKADLQEVAKSFSQFDRYIDGKDKYCSNDIEEKWFKIAKSLVLLKNAAPDEPDTDSDDAMTFKAISEKDWWSYFTRRADTFSIDEGCREGVVAYVYRFFRGTIYLCDLFFEQPISSQASTLMHEVRHFDGYGHVTCTQGNENGMRGACDEKITDRGSYAISLQTLVGLARSEQTPAEEKGALEAEAVYMAFNKYNVVPQVKMENAIVLSNSLGEVYRWVVGKSAKLIKKLDDAAVVRASGANLTIYPIDTSIDAYRMDGGLTATLDNPGLYAKFYNEDSESERENFKSISYFGTGGLLKGNTLITLCDGGSAELGQTDLSSRGDFVRIINLPKEDSEREYDSYLLKTDGSLLKYECRSRTSPVVEFSSTRLSIDTGLNIVHSFSIEGDKYALLEDGSLASLDERNKVITASDVSMPISNEDWVSATPLSKAEVF